MIFNIGKITNKRATELLNEFKNVYNYKIYKLNKFNDLPGMGKYLGYNSGVYGFNFNITVNEAKKRVFVCGDYTGTFKDFKKLSYEDTQKIWITPELLDKWEQQEQKTE